MNVTLHDLNLAELAALAHQNGMIPGYDRAVLIEQLAAFYRSSTTRSCGDNPPHTP